MKIFLSKLEISKMAMDELRGIILEASSPPGVTYGSRTPMSVIQGIYTDKR